ncbi:hypothetical protein BaRGS_00034468 [Batillaria attramentaria]|uniref:Uncharacterized protein n=1 Tax=Batillaria attramentaria TaxID=370345 RepID=A0ABD0JHD5_9CAEN
MSVLTSDVSSQPSILVVPELSPGLSLSPEEAGSLTLSRGARHTHTCSTTTRSRNTRQRCDMVTALIHGEAEPTTGTTTLTPLNRARAAAGL